MLCCHGEVSLVNTGVETKPLFANEEEWTETSLSKQDSISSSDSGSFGSKSESDSLTKVESEPLIEFSSHLDLAKIHTYS